MGLKGGSRADQPARRATHVAVALAVALAIGCAGPGGGRRVASQAERDAYAYAVAPLPKDPAMAIERLEAFVAANPDSTLADDACEKLARVHLEQGRRDEATRWLYRLIRNYPESDRSDRARIVLARIEHERGNREAALQLLARLRYSRLNDLEKASAYQLEAELAQEPVERLRWLGELRTLSLGLDERARIEGEIDDQLATLSDEDLERAAQLMRRRPLESRIVLAQVERALAISDTELARERLDTLDGVELLGRDLARLERLRHSLELAEQVAADDDLLPEFEQVAAAPRPDTTGASGTIGVVLPLTGTFASYGETSLRGVLLAARIFGAAGAVDIPVAPASPALDRNPDDALPGVGATDPGAGRRGVVRVVVRDSRGEPEGAARAVRELAEIEDLVAIVGPLFSAEAEAAAEAAEAAGVPLLTLTNREEVPRARPNVFRLRTTPDDELRFLVGHAVKELGARRFAILFPESRYGRGMRERFWAAVEEQGASVVAVSSYDESATDFADAIRGMIGYTLLTGEEKAALVEREALLRRARRLEPEEAAVVREAAYAILGPEGERLPPIVDFDALFIPDGHDKVVLIAPQLAFNDVSRMQLLGTADWRHPDLLSIARRHVRGAVISTSFDAESRFDFVSDFVADYEGTFGLAPDVFAANAFDAARLVLVQLAAGGEGRDAVRDGVGTTHAFPGASGVITLMPDGNARKRPFLLGVRGGRFVPLD